MYSNTKHRPGYDLPKWTSVILLGLVLGIGPLASDAVGFRQITDDNLTFGVWYPSDTQTIVQRLGPFDVNVAKDAPVRDGQYETLLLSHGNGGRFRNHYLTAQALADAGYIVIAPQHKADYLIGGRSTAQALDHRYIELAMALRSVESDSHFTDHIVPHIVHGVGYSLGGATILLAAGSGFSSQRLVEHCREHGSEDAEYCGNTGKLFRVMQYFRHLVQRFQYEIPDLSLPDTSDPFRNQPFINGKAVMVAPAYQGIDLTSPTSIAKLMVIAIEGDTIAKPEFQARPLFEAASKDIPSHYQAVPGHHYAFIAPFPKWLTDEEDILVAKDPEGFDRLKFLMTVNDSIVDFMIGD